MGAITSATEEIRERVDAIARDIVCGPADRRDPPRSMASPRGRGGPQLAEQSKAATAQVESILGDDQTATSAAVTASQEGTKVVEQIA